MEHKNITQIKEDCWRITFLEKCHLHEIYFFSSDDPSEKSLKEILSFPQVERDISFKQALLQIRASQVPNKFRQQKKMFRRITDELSTESEEHF